LAGHLVARVGCTCPGAPRRISEHQRQTLSGRSPLYHLQTAFADCDRALLFGQDLPAQAFSDDTVGRMLDGFYEVGRQRIFSALSVAALERFPVSTQHAHFDTTSVTLYGDYLRAIEADACIELGAIEQTPPTRNRPGAFLSGACSGSAVFQS
jgi:hypothetical protein